jgi:hypothetical protein
MLDQQSIEIVTSDRRRRRRTATAPQPQQRRSVARQRGETNERNEPRRKESNETRNVSKERRLFLVYRSDISFMFTFAKRSSKRH